MKKQLILSLALAAMAVSPAFGRTACYARANQNVTFTLDWSGNNYGNIQWQSSADDGASWTDIAGATSPTLTFKADKPGLYRVVVDGDPACHPIIDERQLQLVAINSTLLTNGSDYIEIEVDASELADAGVVEYGFTAAMAGVGRNYTILPRHKVGSALPSPDGRFDMKCSGLQPAQQYSVRPYFVTADGSVVFGAGKAATTLAGLRFDTEDWLIEKTLVQVPFSTPGCTTATQVKFSLGKDTFSLKAYDVECLGDGKYRSQLINGLNPGTQYLAQIEATIDGQTSILEKTVTTWGDYSGYVADNTVKPVSHVVEWDKDNLICLTPEANQVEYPRMCRVDENKILLTYHGGASDHWQNSYLRKSYDNGRSWTDPVEIYRTGDTFLGSGYHRICNPEMTRLANGWIILTVVANGNPENNNTCKVLACISQDGGETWGDPFVVGRGRTWEPQVIQLPGGELELLVSSEAYWWDNQRNNLFQEILSTRSTDNGLTWTTYKRASYKPGARDGMPVAVVMQDNKGVLFIEESVNGGIRRL